MMNGWQIVANSRFDALVYVFFGIIWIISQIVNVKAKRRKREEQNRQVNRIRVPPPVPVPSPRSLGAPQSRAGGVGPEEELRKFLRDLAGGEVAEEPTPMEVFQAPPVPVASSARPGPHRVYRHRPPARIPVQIDIPSRPPLREPVPAAPAASVSSEPTQSRSVRPPTGMAGTRPGPVRSGSPARFLLRASRSRAALREAFIWKTLLEPPVALRPDAGAGLPPARSC